MQKKKCAASPSLQAKVVKQKKTDDGIEVKLAFSLLDHIMERLLICQPRSQGSLLPALRNEVDYFVTLTLKSVHEIVWCYHSNETSSAERMDTSLMQIHI